MKKQTLNKKLKLIKDLIGDNVVFSVGVNRNNDIDILKVERIFYPEIAEDIIVEEGEINNPKKPIRRYIG